MKTAGITQEIRRALCAVDRTTKATKRRIALAEAPHIARAVRALVRQAQPGDVAGVLVVRGGYVNNSYNYRAMCDEVRVELDLRAGTWGVSAERVNAQSRPLGIGDLTIARLKRAGQTQGRVVAL